MPVGSKSLQQLASNTLGWRIREHNAALRFKLNQLVIEHIIFLVANLRRIQGVIVVIVLIQLCYELFHGMHNVHPGVSLRHKDNIYKMNLRMK
ncbi:hypothetical protein D3C75_942350 [compost metagenome]